MAHKRLLVVGAGPKGVALAAKTAALSRLDVDVPHVVLIDCCNVGANWTGQHGFTDGLQSLATSPLKDVGFPYRSECWDHLDRSVDSLMLDFSWPAYLISSRGVSANQYASWIDRGMPDPYLDEWARYLKWVMAKAQQEKVATLKIGQVSRIAKGRDGWHLTMAGEDEPVTGDALVITGPGDVTGVKGQLNGDRISDAKHFWGHPLLHRLQRHRNDRITVAVIGAGGAAASVVLTLLRSMGERCAIQVISPWGVVYTRGESYDENRHLTDPQHWVHLGEPNQMRFLDHTSQGVFSQHVKRVMNTAVNVETVAGWVLEVQENPSRVRMLMKGSVAEDCDYAIVATGFDDMWWAKPDMLENQLIHEVRRCAGGAPVEAEFVRRHINDNLQLDQMSPPLHLPMLAGQRQGPGFPNLNCLGLLSDRILRPHCHIEESGKT